MNLELCGNLQKYKNVKMKERMRRKLEQRNAKILKLEF